MMLVADFGTKHRRGGHGLAVVSASRVATLSGSQRHMNNATPIPLDTRSRTKAAIAHFGMPLYGPFCPLLIWKMSTVGGFERQHASTAFTLQLLFLACHIALFAAFILGATPLARSLVSAST